MSVVFESSVNFYFFSCPAGLVVASTTVERRVLGSIPRSGNKCYSVILLYLCLRTHLCTIIFVCVNVGLLWDLNVFARIFFLMIKVGTLLLVIISYLPVLVIFL